MKGWLLKFHYHLLYWIILFGLAAGIAYQRAHIEFDHQICLIDSFPTEGH